MFTLLWPKNWRKRPRLGLSTAFAGVPPSLYNASIKTLTFCLPTFVYSFPCLQNAFGALDSDSEDEQTPVAQPKTMKPSANKAPARNGKPGDLQSGSMWGVDAALHPWRPCDQDPKANRGVRCVKT